MRVKLVTFPFAIFAVAVAGSTCGGASIVTDGGLVLTYPAPTSVILIAVTTPFVIDAVAVALIPVADVLSSEYNATGGISIVTLGATRYPLPATLIVISVIFPVDALTTGVTVHCCGTTNDGGSIVTVGPDVYPEPPLSTPAIYNNAGLAAVYTYVPFVYFAAASHVVVCPDCLYPGVPLSVYALAPVPIPPSTVNPTNSNGPLYGVSRET